MARKFRVGRPCKIDDSIDGVLAKVPFKNRYGEWFVVVTVDDEDMALDGTYYPMKDYWRILKERVKII